MTRTEDDRLLTPRLIKAARALLDWDQFELAKRAKTSRKTLSLIESATSAPSDPRRIEVLTKIRLLLQEEGVEITFAGPDSGEGVRLLRHRP